MTAATDLLRAWWSWFPAVAGQAAVAILVLLVLDRLLSERLGAGFRQALWGLAAVKLVLPPDLLSPLGLARLLPAEEAVAGAPAATVAPDAALPLVWLAGFALLATLFVFRERRRAARLLAGSRPAGPEAERVLRSAARRAGIRRPPALRVSAAAPGPMVLGVLRPRIVLPADIEAAPAALGHVLLHELAHVRRRDLIRQAAWSLLTLAYWFHPLVWVARARAAAAREFGCDAAVARLLGGKTEGYRRTLLASAARAAGLAPAGPAPGLALLSPVPVLAARLRALAGRDRAPRRRLFAGTAVAAALAAALLPMGRPPSAPSPGPREIEEARRSVLYGIENPERAGSLALRNAMYRLHALESRESGESP